MIKKVMIVGTGYGQLPLIAACRKLGFYSIGVDFNQNSLGAGLVDKFYQQDIKDIPAVLAVAREENIDAVVTIQSDLPVPTIGKINDELNLSGVTFETALICSHKDKTRLALEKHGINQPNFHIINNLDEAVSAVNTIGFPCVIKAVDSSGSRGVVKVSEQGEVKTAFEEASVYSRSGNILVEEFIDGIEIGAQTFSQDGECLYCFIHNDTLSENGYMIPTGHSYPFNQISIDEKNVKQSISSALDAVGLKNGPANIDLMVTAKGEVHIIEIGARVGATCLLELTSIYSGLPWEELVIHNALGEKLQSSLLKKQACAAFILQAPQDGDLIEINHHYVIEDYAEYEPIIEVTAIVGQKVSELRKGTDRIGRVVVTADCVEKAIDIASELRSKIEFKIKADV